ncbi:MAG TPA: tetratricopeptide repeat protein [Pyrinomonadaceae bacterium]|nr:tetratricopeptide repeat protein [Pyrinomonadaceae bacterium]
MNKVLIFLFFSLFFLCYSIFSQENANKGKELNDKVAALLQSGKLDEAIEVGEKLVKLEKDANSPNTISYANALLNLARMKRDVFLILRNKLISGNIESGSRSAASQKASESAKQSDSLYREALQLNEQSGRAETTQTADIKTELGWLIYNYSPSKQGIDNSEKFLLESIALNEKLRGKDAEQTLFVVLKTGDFYNEFDNYEKALSFYERYIQIIENKSGKDSLALVNALRPVAKILFTTFQEQEAKNIVKRIEELTKKSEGMPKPDLDFHLRSKNSVAMTMSLIPIYQEEMKNFRAMLKAQGRTLNSNNISQVSKLLRVLVNVVVDEEGKVIEAVADSQIKDKKLAKRAENEVSKWFVRPFSYNGMTRKMRGELYYLEFDK